MLLNRTKLVLLMLMLTAAAATAIDYGPVWKLEPYMLIRNDVVAPPDADTLNRFFAEAPLEITFEDERFLTVRRIDGSEIEGIFYEWVRTDNPADLYVGSPRYALEFIDEQRLQRAVSFVDNGHELLVVVNYLSPESGGPQTRIRLFLRADFGRTSVRELRAAEYRRPGMEAK